MSEWYLVVEGQAQGPVSTETVLACLKTRDRAEVQVWREGFDDWRLAKDVAEFRAAAPLIPLVAIRDPEIASETTATGSRNFIVRHWRGELPLWVSYWVINILGGL